MTHGGIILNYSTHSHQCPPLILRPSLSDPAIQKLHLLFRVETVFMLQNFTSQRFDFLFAGCHGRKRKPPMCSPEAGKPTTGGNVGGKLRLWGGVSHGDIAILAV